jgi:hypothetical protein
MVFMVPSVMSVSRLGLLVSQLDQCGLTDAPATGHLREVPSVPANDLGDCPKLIRSTVKAPFHDATNLG